ncbi:MAG: rhomboid family intramembrane serine protease [Planctomycetota bacterium]
MGPITKALIGANVAVFALQNVLGDVLVAEFALWPFGLYPVSGGGSVGFQPWQLVTSAFLHASPTHIGLNMLALWMFGRDVEHALGASRYFTLYTAAVVTAALTQLVVVSTASAGAVYPTVGASGGVFGLLLAFGTIFPRRTVMLLFPPIPMPARVFVFVYGAIELVNGVLGTTQGVAHFAHLGGMLGAWVVLARWRARSASSRGAP